MGEMLQEKKHHWRTRPSAGQSESGLGLFFIILLVICLAGCPASSEKPLVVFGSPDSPRLRQVVSGLETGLAPRKVKVIFAPVFDEASLEAVKHLREQKPELIIALGSAALLRLAPLEKLTPIVFAAVANPYAIGVADDPRHPELHQKNVTGLASPPPVKAALEHGAKLFGSRPWGLIYDPGEGVAAEVAELFAAQAPNYGLTPFLEASTGTEGDELALRRLLARGARVLYLPPTATAARYAPLLLTWGRERRIPVVSSLPQEGQEGAVLKVSLDYEILGREAASLVLKVLSGVKPEFLPITECTPLKISLNETLWHYWTGYPIPLRIPSRKGADEYPLTRTFLLEEFPS